MTKAIRTRHLRQPRQGFTLIEMLTVIALIGIIASITIPIYLELTRKAKATAIVTDFTFVRQEITRYHSDLGSWPRGARWGQEPRDLRPYLEGRMRFDHGVYQYRLRNRMRRPEGRVPWRLAFEVRGDERILEHVERIWGDSLDARRNRRGLRITFEIAR